MSVHWEAVTMYSMVAKGFGLVLCLCAYVCVCLLMCVFVCVCGV